MKSKRHRRRLPKHGRSIQVARHEAAHAVVAIYLDEDVSEVVILPNGKKMHGYAKIIHRAPIDPMTVAIVCYAGVCAEENWHRFPKTAISDGDHDQVVEMGFRGRSLPTLRLITRNIVEELAEQIEAVAQALKKKDLTGREVRKILKGCKTGS